MTQQTSDADPQVTSIPCARCGNLVDPAHMIQLEDGRGLCRACRSIVLGARRQRRHEERVRKQAAARGESPAPTRTKTPGYMPKSANDAAADVLATGAAVAEGGTDESVPCPSCDVEILIGVPRCDACDADLSEYWEHDELVHPPSLLRRAGRLAVRLAIVAVLVTIGVMTLPEDKRKNYFESILGERFVGPGRGLDDAIQGVELHPALTRKGTALVIRNDDPFHWDSVVVSLNATRGRGGYRAEALQRIWAGSTQKIPLSKFRKADNQQFLTEGMKIETVTISADTPRGTALWSRPMDDPTETTTLERNE